MQTKIREIIEKIIPIIFLIIGILLLAYPMITNRALLPGDLADTRFIHYLLEHGWLWIHQEELHTNLWNMPIFYDYKNTLAYSDFMLGAMAIYIPIRELFNPHDSLRIWFFIVCILNYLSMFFLLRKCFKFNIIPSSMGALLFAFSLPRTAQLEHFQLFTQFFMIISLIAFLHIDREKSRIHNHLCFFTGTTFFALQIYTCFYLGWFMILGGIIFLLITMLFRENRKELIEFIKLFYVEIIIYSLYTIIITLPLINHYLAVGAQFSYTMLDFRILKLKYLLSSNSIIDGFIYKVQDVYGYNMMGIGYLTLILVIFGILQDKEHRKTTLLFIITVLSFFMIGGLNYILYKVIPGASAIRASSRIIFLILPIYSYYLAKFLQNVNIKALSTIIVILIYMEQITPLYYNWSRDEHIKRINSYSVPQNCKVVFLDLQSENNFDEIVSKNVDIMWLGIEKKFNTINGYSGYFPRIKSEIVENECKI